jgi:hypothetical protein
VSWDFGFFDDDGEFIASGGRIDEPRKVLVNPWPVGSRVTVPGDPRVGVVRVNAFADGFSFRVQYPNGKWAPKASSHELRTARGWGLWNFVLRGFRRVPRWLREYIEDVDWRR